GVGLVVELVYGGEDAGAGVRADFGVVVEDARHGLVGDAGECGDLVQGRCTRSHERSLRRFEVRTGCCAGQRCDDGPGSGGSRLPHEQRVAENGGVRGSADVRPAKGGWRQVVVAVVSMRIRTSQGPSCRVSPTVRCSWLSTSTTGWSRGMSTSSKDQLCTKRR